MDEREAIAHLKAGDISGLEALVRMHQVDAVRTAFLITHDSSLAEDVVQAAFIRAYERIAGFQADRPFRPWFLRLVVNEAIKAAVRQKREVSLEELGAQGATDGPEAGRLTDQVLGPEELVEQNERKAAIRSAIRKLPPKERAVVVLRYYACLSEAEIAMILGRPRGTIKWLAHQAKKRLRERLMGLFFARRQECAER